jgi:hypothetical protein
MTGTTAIRIGTGRRSGLRGLVRGDLQERAAHRDLLTHAPVDGCFQRLAVKENLDAVERDNLESAGVDKHPQRGRGDCRVGDDDVGIARHGTADVRVAEGQPVHHPRSWARYHADLGHPCGLGQRAAGRVTQADHRPVPDQRVREPHVTGHPLAEGEQTRPGQLRDAAVQEAAQLSSDLRYRSIGIGVDHHIGLPSRCRRHGRHRHPHALPFLARPYEGPAVADPLACRLSTA